MFAQEGSRSEYILPEEIVSLLNNIPRPVEDVKSIYRAMRRVIEQQGTTLTVGRTRKLLTSALEQYQKMVTTQEICTFLFQEDGKRDVYCSSCNEFLGKEGILKIIKVGDPSHIRFTQNNHGQLGYVLKGKERVAILELNAAITHFLEGHQCFAGDTFFFDPLNVSCTTTQSASINPWALEDFMTRERQAALTGPYRVVQESPFRGAFESIEEIYPHILTPDVLGGV